MNSVCLLSIYVGVTHNITGGDGLVLMRKNF